MRRQGSSILPIGKICFLVILTTQVLEAYPRGYERANNEGTASSRSREPSEEEFANRTVQRDASRIQDGRSTRAQLKRSGQMGFGQPYPKQGGFSSSESEQSDGQIVFPTDDTMSQPCRYNTMPAPVCQGSTFCESSTYYPEEVVNRAIQQNDSLRYLAAVDEVTEIVHRIDVTEDTPLCVSDEQVVYPKSAENRRKEWLFVVNQDNFRQGIRIEKCRDEKKECSVIDGLAEGYRTSCKQKYIYRQLAAVSSDGTVVPDMFRFPSSCCCHLKFIGSPLSRMGVSLGEQRSQTTPAKTRRRK